MPRKPCFQFAVRKMLPGGPTCSSMMFAQNKRLTVRRNSQETIVKRLSYLYAQNYGYWLILSPGELLGPNLTISSPALLLLKPNSSVLIWSTQEISGWGGKHKVKGTAELYLQMHVNGHFLALSASSVQLKIYEDI